ncbi:hypothetical protein ETU10_06020 [Apibacter muscae]|uniref:hypothetical protein n=1 Tax=Apibacter muscae TaxID=2509004 RepID=UPI0011AD12DE|nr:hypothetical protein [Apibacter muscae]TWP23788.1 hypothetical protein ETU10_06020 [Apibacter muscae]
MLKKLQSNLLVNHPLLWNLKLVPILILIVIFNILFFFLGYFSTKFTFNNYTRFPYDHYNEPNFPLYGIAILSSFLTLIVWLAFYLKNNGFKSLYPRTSFSLFKEWILSYFIIIGAFLYCFSFYQGSLTKTRSYASLEETNKTLDLLVKINYLIPNVYLNDYNDIESGIFPNSLLSLKNYQYTRKDSIYSHQVHEWLIKENKDSIKSTLNSFLDLHKKHHLKTNLTTDTWIKFYYHPPEYILDSYLKLDNYKDNYYYFNHVYHNIFEAYNSLEPVLKFVLITFYIALVFSLIIFSIRVTHAKAWITSFIILGLLIFTSGIFMAILDFISFGYTSQNLYTYFWLLTFLILFLHLESKILGKNKTKGFSSISLNLVLWIFPFVPYIIFIIFMNWCKNLSPIENRSSSCIYSYFSENLDKFLWLNLILSIVVLFFFVKQIKVWKSLPEE